MERGAGHTLHFYDSYQTTSSVTTEVRERASPIDFEVIFGVKSTDAVFFQPYAFAELAEKVPPQSNRDRSEHKLNNSSLVVSSPCRCN